MKLHERDVVAAIRRLQLRELRSWVRAGWIKPAQSDAGPHFDELDIARIRLICDLRKDMALPNDAVPMILSLLDQVHGLRHELQCLGDAINRQPEQTRKAIFEAYWRRGSQNSHPGNTGGS
jgi:chaperone modulatory protein CbpM